MIKLEIINNNESSKINNNVLFDVISNIDTKYNKLDNKFNYEIAILITDNKEIKYYNNKYRSKNKETNILSFPNIDEIDREINPIIGDIIISEEKLTYEAMEQNKRFNNHLKHIFLHGVLHLFGYNHENEHDAQIMESIEVEILRKLNINNPYIDNKSE